MESRGAFPGPEAEPESEGLRYLRMLDLGDIADLPIPGDPTKTAQDFLDICGDHALPVLKGIESLPEDDPRRVQGIAHFQTLVRGMFAPPEQQ